MILRYLCILGEGGHYTPLFPPGTALLYIASLKCATLDYCLPPKMNFPYLRIWLQLARVLLSKVDEW